MAGYPSWRQPSMVIFSMVKESSIFIETASLVIADQAWREIYLPMRWRLYSTKHPTGISRGLQAKKIFMAQQLIYVRIYLFTLIFFIKVVNAIINRSNRQEVLYKKGVHRHFAKFTGKHLWLSLFFNKVAGLRVSFLIKLQAFIKKRLWHRYFSVNFAKFLRTPFS